MPNLNQPKRPIFVIGQSRATPLSILTVYRHPKDHPDKYVVREFILDVDGQLLARKSCDLADTLEEARKFIPGGAAASRSRIPQGYQPWSRGYERHALF